MSKRTLGQRWIQFLRGYTPIPQNDSMITEKVSNLARRHKITPVTFEHPLEKQFLSLFVDNSKSVLTPDKLTNVILTGTAGDGKTALCYKLWENIFETPIPTGSHASQKILIDNQEVEFTFIFDFSAYFKLNSDGTIREDIQSDLEEFANTVFSEGHGSRFFIIAVNDGQFAELWQCLPSNSVAKKLEPLITELHASNKQHNNECLHFFNLSTIPTPELFSRIYDAIVFRPEWDDCFQHNPLDEFSPESSLYKNYQALKSANYKHRLFQLVSLCDACNSHIPIRELLMWLANGLLGFKSAHQGVAILKDLRNCALRKNSHEAPLHSNLFGENISTTQRERFAIFRFLAGIKLGNETINDLDELIIFGDKLDNFKAAHTQFVAANPFGHRSLDFTSKVNNYIRGEGEDHSVFLDALADERRRLFFSAEESKLESVIGGQSIWITTTFHYAGSYLNNIMNQTFDEKAISLKIVKKLILGLNRIWTGLLAEDDDKLIVAKGLNLSSAAISDVFVFGIPIVDDFGEHKIKIIHPKEGSLIPQMEIKWKEGCNSFSFDLSLQRFEFLSRVADGVMPNAFSKECWEDAITLKTKLLRQFYEHGLNPTQIRSIATDFDGRITAKSIA